MKKKVLFFVSIFLCLYTSEAISEEYNFITLDDEFNNRGKITSITSSSFYLKNRSEFLKRNVFDINKSDLYGNEKYSVIALEQGFRYGFSDTINLLTNFGFSINRLSSLNEYEEIKYNNKSFDFVSFGLSKKLGTYSSYSDINNSISISTDFYTKNSKFNLLKNFSVVFFTERTIDPVVLSLKTGINFYSKIKNNSYTYKQPNEITIRPRIDFIANQKISINLSSEIKIISSEKINDKKINPSGVENYISIGSSYNIDNSHRLYFESSFNTTGSSGATVYFNFEKDF